MTTPVSHKKAFHVYHQYTLRTSRRDELSAHLNSKGVPSMVYYPYPLHQMKVFEGRMKIWEILQKTECAAREVLSLPIEPLLIDSEIDYVIHSVKEFYND